MDERKVPAEQAQVDEGRRKLVKAVAIGGGAVAAAAAIPGAWKKPLATVGGLPAHAQTSEGPITAVELLDVGLQQPSPVGSQDLNVLSALFSFEDPMCQIDDTATLWAKVGPCDTILFNHQRLRNIGAKLQTARGCAGTVRFSFVNNCDPWYSGTLAIQLSKGLRHSNVLNGSFEIAPG